MTALLEVDNIHTYYGKIHALRGVSLTVEEGEVVTLIGANGAGKTTTLRTICGLLTAAEGSIRLRGQDITKMRPDQIVLLGVSQSPEGRRIFKRMSVRENLAMGAYTRNDPTGIEKDLDYVFQTFPRLKERINQAGGTLSGGEQQMLAMGRALMARPKLLLLDEPSMGLAPLLVQEIFRIITYLNKNGTTILLVEQNALMALDVADRGYVVQTGVITLTDSAKSLKANETVRKAYLGGG
jgi:branched-chain amino acid transport system ATP-binding protein